MMVTAVVVCLERTLTVPLDTPDSRIAALTCGVMSCSEMPSFVSQRELGVLVDWRVGAAVVAGIRAGRRAHRAAAPRGDPAARGGRARDPDARREVDGDERGHFTRFLL